MNHLQSNTPTFADVKHIPIAFKGLGELTSSGCSFCDVKHILGLLPDGKISLCGIGSIDETIVFGDVRRDPEALKDIWRDHPFLNEMRRDLPAKLEGVCSICVFRDRCLGSCRAEVFYSGGSITAGPSQFCQQAYEQGLFPATRLVPESLRA